MIREVLAQAAKLAQESETPAVLCRLVETRGSTPQKAGAAMVVLADGSQVGTLGGGCVEAEVRRKALRLQDASSPQLITFHLDSDYGWDDGLICGGRMRVLLDPLTAPTARDYLTQLAQHFSENGGGTEVVVMEPFRGLSVGERLFFDPQGKLLFATSARAEKVAAEVASLLRPLEEHPRPYSRQALAFLPTAPRCRLLVVGAGHVGQAVANLAVELDFEVWVMDDRVEFVSRERFPKVHRLLCGSFDDLLSQVEVTPQTYCLIVTRGHNHDEKALYYLIQRPARYIGMIGSRRKIRLIFEDLISQGIDPARLAEVYAPVGIDIGSQTVMEIAISILAELVAHRNRQGQVPGRPQKVSVACEG